jgi:hypothetical protein
LTALAWKNKRPKPATAVVADIVRHEVTRTTPANGVHRFPPPGFGRGIKGNQLAGRTVGHLRGVAGLAGGTHGLARPTIPIVAGFIAEI